MDKQTVGSHKELIVWQKAMELVVSIFLLCERYPKTELYGLTAQTKRSAVSIPSNIAEGRRRGTRADFCHFLRMAFGSGAELETQLEIARRLTFGKDLNFSEPAEKLEEVMKILNVMIRKLNPQ